MIPFLKLRTGVECRVSSAESRKRAECAWIGFALGVVLMTLVFAAVTLITR